MICPAYGDEIDCEK